MLTQSFADAIAEAEKIITGAPHVQTEADLAEGYDYLAGVAMRALRAHSAPAAVGPEHRCALSDFGLTDGEADERFAGYLR